MAGLGRQAPVLQATPARRHDRRGKAFVLEVPLACMTRVGERSPDGQWQWSGAEWLPAAAAGGYDPSGVVVAPVAPVVPAAPAQPASAVANPWPHPQNATLAGSVNGRPVGSVAAPEDTQAGRGRGRVLALLALVVLLLGADGSLWSVHFYEDTDDTTGRTHVQARPFEFTWTISVDDEEEGETNMNYGTPWSSDDDNLAFFGIPSDDEVDSVALWFATAVFGVVSWLAAGLLLLGMVAADRGGRLRSVRLELAVGGMLLLAVLISFFVTPMVVSTQLDGMFEEDAPTMFHPGFATDELADEDRIFATPGWGWLAMAVGGALSVMAGLRQRAQIATGGAPFRATRSLDPF